MNLKQHIKDHSYWIDKTDVVSYKATIGENNKKEIMVVFNLDGMNWTGEVLTVTDNQLLVYLY